MNKPINWFEIPALDIDRASAFYEQIFAITLNRAQSGPASLAIFPYDRDHSTGGCLRSDPGLNPSIDGAIVYLNAGDALDSVLARVAPAGGSIVRPRTELPPGAGAYAHIADTEGNRVGVYGAA